MAFPLSEVGATAGFAAEDLTSFLTNPPPPFADWFVALILWQGQRRKQRTVKSLCSHLGETERRLSQDRGGQVG